MRITWHKKSETQEKKKNEWKDEGNISNKRRTQLDNSCKIELFID